MLNRFIAKCFSELTKTPAEAASKVSGVAVDSRLIQPHNIYFALPGAQTDGHLYVEDALKKGAIAAVVNEDFHGEAGWPLVRAKDPLQLLQALAKAVQANSPAKIVAVTGSMGKTTTKNFIGHLLAPHFKTAVSPGNSNSQIGLPLAILNNTQGNEEVVVLEMGMTEAGQIRQLVGIAPPDIAVLTAVALVHVSQFEGIEQIAWAKAEIFTHPKTSIGLINKAAVAYDAIAKSCVCPIKTFSCHLDHADYSTAYSDEKIILKEKSETIELEKFPVVGKHNVQNFLAAAAVARQFGISWKQIVEQAKTVSLPPKRMQIVEKFGITFVDDSYNAAPEAVKAALDSLPKPQAGGRTIVVLGAMLELGKLSEGCHREIGEHALKVADILFCYGNECLPMMASWEEAGRHAEHFFDRAAMVKQLQATMQTKDVVLLKGSRSTGIYKIIDELGL